MKTKVKRKLLITRLRSIINESREKNGKAAQKTAHLGERTRNERARRMAAVDHLLSQRIVSVFAKARRQQLNVCNGRVGGDY